jgi:hypothetical protein
MSSKTGSTSAAVIGELLADAPQFPSDIYPFETLSFESQLDILEENGAATFRRRQRIRFLEDNVSFFIDRVWGEGVILAGYSPGRGMSLVDSVRNEGRWALLLSFSRRFRKGDSVEIETERRIVGAFTESGGYWELAMNAPTRMLSLQVKSPRKRTVSEPEIVAPARGELSFKMSGADAQFVVKHPALHVPYRVEWRWKRKSRAISARPSRG